MSRSELKETNNHLTMGVGNGNDNLFVHGDYDSIKVLQEKLLELEALRRENIEIKAKIAGEQRGQ